jgi:hypothetical protein
MSEKGKDAMTAATTDTRTVSQQAAFLAALLDPAIGCMELRIFDAEQERGGAIVKAGRFKATYAGWTVEPTVIARWAGKARGISVFVTVNPVKRDLLARSNKLERQKHVTADADIACLRWAFLDLDPKRPADISATETERQAALECRDKILADHPEITAASLWGCSGNGGFILVRLANLPNDKTHKAMVRRLLETIAARYSGDYQGIRIEIDLATLNPARVMGLVGTQKCKGVDTEERPHRRVTLDSPLDASPEPLDLAAWLSLHAPAQEPGAQAGNGETNRRREPKKSTSGAENTNTVFDDFNARADWFRDVLPQGWTKDMELPNGEIRLTRPGKDSGSSATIGHDGRDLLHVFTSNAPPFQAGETYNKAQVFTLTQHGGDYAKAAVAMESLGYGARAKARRSQRANQQEPQLRNFYLVDGGKESTELQPRALSLPKIVESMNQITGGWPKRVGEELFVATADHRAVTLTRSTQLFGWLAGKARLDWRAGSTMVGQEQFFEHVRKFSAERFDTVQYYPHWPAIKGAFYLHPAVKPKSDATLLDQFLNFFTPETDEDRELIKAAVLTLFWGGPPGMRPVFRIEGPEDDDPKQQGRGVGKSTLPELLGSVCGGHVNIRDGEDVAKFKTRLLSGENIQVRLIILDNLKVRRFSWADYESLVTGRVIDGHKLYVGGVQRPNYYTHFVTVNSGSLSKDMCQRSVTIHLNRPVYSTGWLAAVCAFIETHRWELIAEIGGVLTDEPLEIAGASRWSLWEEQVLSHCELFDECRAKIKERAGDLDDDDVQAAEFERLIEAILKGRGHQPDAESIWIPTSVMAEWFSWFKGEPRAACTATGSLKLMPLKFLRYKRKEIGAGWLWVGPKASAKEVNISPFVGDSDHDEYDEWLKAKRGWVDMLKTNHDNTLPLY